MKMDTMSLFTSKFVAFFFNQFQIVEKSLSEQRRIKIFNGSVDSAALRGFRIFPIDHFGVFVNFRWIRKFWPWFQLENVQQAKCVRHCCRAPNAENQICACIRIQSLRGAYCHMFIHSINQIVRIPPHWTQLIWMHDIHRHDLYGPTIHSWNLSRVVHLRLPLESYLHVAINECETGVWSFQACPYVIRVHTLQMRAFHLPHLPPTLRTPVHRLWLLTRVFCRHVMRHMSFYCSVTGTFEFLALNYIGRGAVAARVHSPRLAPYSVIFFPSQKTHVGSEHTPLTAERSANSQFRNADEGPKSIEAKVTEWNGSGGKVFCAD